MTEPHTTAVFPFPGDETWDESTRRASWLRHHAAIWAQLPADGYLAFPVFPGDGGPMKEVDFAPVHDAEACWKVIKKLSKVGGELYVSMTPRLDSIIEAQKTKPGHGDHTQLTSARMLWVEVDADDPSMPPTKQKNGVDAKGNPKITDGVLYPTAEKARLIIADLCKRLPFHSIVSSGIGAHLVLLVDDEVTRADAAGFEALVQDIFTRHNRRFDRGVTVRPTTVLRPAGAHHTKIAERPLPVWFVGGSDQPPMSLETLRGMFPEDAARNEHTRPLAPDAVDDRPGTKFNAALPVTEVLEKAGIEFSDLTPGAGDRRIAFPQFASQHGNDAAVYIEDGIEKVCIYSETVAKALRVQYATPLQAFDLLAQRVCGGGKEGYNLAARLCGRHEADYSPVIELIGSGDKLGTTELAEIAAAAPPAWPEGLTDRDAAYLRFRGVSAEVARKRGYSSLHTDKDTSFKPEDWGLAKTDGSGAEVAYEGLITPVLPVYGKPSSTLRLDPPVVVSAGKKTLRFESEKHVSYRRSMLDVHPYSEPNLLDQSVPLVLVSSDLPPSVESNNHGVVIADAVLSAARASDRKLCVATLRDWESGYLPAGSEVNYTRQDKLSQSFRYVTLHGREVYLVGRSRWRRGRGLARLVRLLADAGAQVRVVDTPRPPCDDGSTVADGSPWSFGDYLASGGNLSDALESAYGQDDALYECEFYEANDIAAADRAVAHLAREHRYIYNADHKSWMKRSGPVWELIDSTPRDSVKSRLEQDGVVEVTKIPALNRITKYTEESEELVTNNDEILAVLDPEEINTRSGVLNIRSGELRPLRDDEVHIAVADVEYDQDSNVDCPRWRKYMHQISCPDLAACAGLESCKGADYLREIQETFGMALIGDNRFRKIATLPGPTGTGKSTITELVLLPLLGGYGTILSPDLIMSGSESKPWHWAVLYGARFAVMSETNPDQRLNPAAFKHIADNMSITGEVKGGKIFTFINRSLVCLTTNHLPTSKALDEAMQDRWVILPWEYQVPKIKRDYALATNLLAERDGIFRWLLEGAQRLLKRGRPVESEVSVKRLAGHVNANDVFGQFIRTHCVVGVPDEGTGLREFKVRTSTFHKKLNAYLMEEEADDRKWAAATVRSHWAQRPQLHVEKKLRDGNEHYVGVALWTELSPELQVKYKPAAIQEEEAAKDEATPSPVEPEASQPADLPKPVALVPPPESAPSWRNAIADDEPYVPGSIAADVRDAAAFDLDEEEL